MNYSTTRFEIYEFFSGPTALYLSHIESTSDNAKETLKSAINKGIVVDPGRYLVCRRGIDPIVYEFMVELVPTPRLRIVEK